MEKPTNSACMGSRLVVSMSKARRPALRASAIHASSRTISCTVSYFDRSILSALAWPAAAVAAACDAETGPAGAF
jgi:hypothetical protein